MYKAHLILSHHFREYRSECVNYFLTILHNYLDDQYNNKYNKLVQNNHSPYKTTYTLV